MKLLTLAARNEENKKYSFVCLENKQDAEYFTTVNALIKSKQAISFWVGFKSQDGFIRYNPMDFVAHEVRENGMASLLAMKMNLSQEPTTLVKYCSDADYYINDMNNTIYEYINRGMYVRINSIGGYCPINDLTEYEKAVDINEQEMYNFLLHKNIKFKFEITKESVVIENDNYIPINTVDSFCQKTKTEKKDIQIFTSFKHRTILFQPEDYIKFFNEGIKAGMKNIIFETTAQDKTQIDKVKNVFEYLMNKHLDKAINIYAKVYDQDKHLFKTKLKNINIIFL